jgi:hypothetical protein
MNNATIMTSTLQHRRLFDLDYAQKTLPLVSRIVRDIVDTQKDLADLHSRACQSLIQGDEAAAEALQDQIQERAHDQADYVAELHELGCEVKDTSIGLVDFPSRLDERVVYLCWKLGEPAITHWHEVDAGVQGRAPISGRSFTS